jgi:hypothetical protein
MEMDPLDPSSFMEPTVTHYYLDMLDNSVLPQIEDNNAIFQQDGPLLQYTTAVNKYLMAHFPGRWTGRGGWKPWPPHSSHLISLDFYHLYRFNKRIFLYFVSE